jgi:hypothetical protein
VRELMDMDAMPMPTVASLCGMQPSKFEHVTNRKTAKALAL